MTRPRTWDPKTVAAVAIPTVLSLGLVGYQLALPSVLFGVHGYGSGIGYDDGVYLGSAIRFVHGVLPYRDFDFLHPPGIIWLMSPVALLGRLTGSRDALAIARCVTALVAGLNVALAALAVRRRGALAMIVTGLALAVFPLAVAADQSLLLEPYLVCFCLLGTLALFRNGEIADSRRVLLAGLAFGFAGSVKIWAIFPVVAVLACCIPRWRSTYRPFVQGCVLGFGVPSIFFVAVAPRAFVHDVLLAQIGRGTSGRGALTIAERLVMITGLGGLPSLDTATMLAVGITLGLAALAAASYAVGFRRCTRLEWFVLLTAAVVTPAMFLSPEFYDHYAYFPAAFLAILVGVCAGRVASGARYLAERATTRPWRNFAKTAAVVPLVGVVVLAAVLVPRDTDDARAYLASANDPGAIVAAHIPQGSCVVSDNPTLLINANRFVPSTPGCPALVDPFGMWIARDDGSPPPASQPFPPAFVADWKAWLDRSDFVVLSVPFSDYLPWTSVLVQWFDQNFVLVSTQPDTYVYSHFDRTPSASVSARIGQGLEADAHGDVVDARAAFSAALAADPANLLATFDLGTIEQHDGELTDAAGSYQQALFIDPTFEPALYNLAVMRATTNPASAISLYDRALAAEPDDADANFNLGLLLYQDGDTADGQSHIAAALRTDPSLASRLPAGVAP